MTKADLERDLTADVERMVKAKEAIQCIVLNPVDFTALTGLDPATVADFGSFLGIPVRLGDRTHVRATLPFRLKKMEREGATEV